MAAIPDRKQVLDRETLKAANVAVFVTGDSPIHFALTRADFLVGKIKIANYASIDVAVPFRFIINQTERFLRKRYVGKADIVAGSGQGQQ
jgi:hypothetical protein